MKITPHQREKWLYSLNKHKTKIDTVVSQQFEKIKQDEAFAQEAYRTVDEDHIDIVCFKSLLNFYTDIMQQLWNNFEKLVEENNPNLKQEPPKEED